MLLLTGDESKWLIVDRVALGSGATYVRKSYDSPHLYNTSWPDFPKITTQDGHVLYDENVEGDITLLQDEKYMGVNVFVRKFTGMEDSTLSVKK